MLVLRFSHVFFGALWVGMMAFQTFFLMPALAEVGPDSGKLMAALMRRRLPVILPIVALITLVSGFWLFQRLSGGAPAGLMRTPMGLAFGSGGLAALLAFLLGIVVMRPAMMRSTALQQSLASASPEERATRSAEIQRLRARGAMTGWVVMILLLYALGAMAGRDTCEAREHPRVACDMMTRTRLAVRHAARYCFATSEMASTVSSEPPQLGSRPGPGAEGLDVVRDLPHLIRRQHIGGFGHRRAVDPGHRPDVNVARRA